MTHLQEVRANLRGEKGSVFRLAIHGLIPHKNQYGGLPLHF